MGDIEWIKLRINMFDDEKIKMIQALPEGDSILVIWIRLIALAGKCNSSGLVLVEDEFPYSDEMLATIFNKSLTTVRLALQTFEKFRMVETTSKGIYITNFEKHQNAEALDKIREQNRLRKQRERERKKALLLEESGGGVPCLPDNGSNNDSDNVTCHVTETGQPREVTHLEEERRKENKEKDIKDISSCEDIVCMDLPTIKAVSEARKAKIRTLLNELDKLKLLTDKTPYERLHTIFQMSQESDFLSGRNGKWNGCSFDWLINKTNALKILEGNYQNKGGLTNGRINSGNNEPNVPGSDNATSEALERFRRNSRNDGV